MNSEILNEAYGILLKKGPLSCSELGWALWGKTSTSAFKGRGVHRDNKFCRPAGKILKQLEVKKMASHSRYKTKTIWKAIPSGEIYGNDFIVDSFLH